MSDKPNDNPKKSTERVVEHNEKFNVPIQTEKEEAEVFENANPESMADDREVRHKKEGLRWRFIIILKRIYLRSIAGALLQLS